MCASMIDIQYAMAENRRGKKEEEEEEEEERRRRRKKKKKKEEETTGQKYMLALLHRMAIINIYNNNH